MTRSVSLPILRVMLAEEGITPSPGLDPVELVRLTSTTDKLSAPLAEALGNALNAAAYDADPKTEHNNVP